MLLIWWTLDSMHKTHSNSKGILRVFGPMIKNHRETLTIPTTIKPSQANRIEEQSNKNRNTTSLKSKLSNKLPQGTMLKVWEGPVILTGYGIFQRMKRKKIKNKLMTNRLKVKMKRCKKLIPMLESREGIHSAVKVSPIG